MKLGILASNFKSVNVSELALSKLASNRMRLNLAKEAALMINYEIMQLNFYSKKERVDLLLIGKIVSESGANIFYDDDGTRIKKWIDYIEFSRKNETKIILDYTDHLLILNDNRKEFYEKILPYVDIVVTPSAKMMENISKYFSKKIEIIEDPIEVEINKIKNINYDVIDALWFGHKVNIVYLLDYIKKSKKINKLKIVTNQLTENDKNIITNLNKDIEVKFIEWEPNFYKINKLECNICLIPSDIKDERKNGVSNNRLITSFALGLIPVATMVKSYSEFKDNFIDIDLFNSFDSRELSEFNKKINVNRELIIEKYTKIKIIKKWSDLLKSNV